MSEIEKSIYNVLIANQTGDKGIRYHAVLVDHKDPESRQPHCMSTCCEGQGTRMMGALPEFIYSVASDGIYVDLYASSALTVPGENGDFSVRMQTNFPYETKVQLFVGVKDPVKSVIRIRVPSWAAKNMNVNINGHRAATGKPGSYITLSRIWKNNDEIRFDLPMSFRITKYEGEEQDLLFDRYALEYGPLLMAYVSQNGETSNIMLPVSPARLIRSLKPEPGKPLHFTVNDNSGFEYMPYFEVQEEAFSCYPLAGLKK